MNDHNASSGTSSPGDVSTSSAPPVQSPSARSGHALDPNRSPTPAGLADASGPATSAQRPGASRLLAMLGFAGAVAGAAWLGRSSNEQSLKFWYRTLKKPPFQPKPAVFGPVWGALYGLMAASGYRTWSQPTSPHRSQALALWGTQLALNAAWSPLFFGARKPRTALVDLGLLVGATSLYIERSSRVDRPAASLMLPYLGWLGFAGVLNEEIVRRNAWRV